mmetsp:Transcript_38065/g.127390  ORF Transcript_38065/g.127390 Transcript_38065/m.127390 type:complete len:385 (+) Transcript_38065:183-1337(+)
MRGEAKQRSPVLLMRRGMTRLDMARCRMSHDGSRHDVEAQRATTRRRSAEREQRGRLVAVCRARSVASRTAARRRRVSRRDRLRLGGARAAERAEECAQPVAFPEARAALHAAVQRGQHLRQLDPPLLLGREAGGDGHGEGDDPVLARDGRVRVRLDRVDEGDCLRLVGCDVARHEKVVRQVGHPHKVAREDASRVGVHVVGHHHRRRAERLCALVVAVRRLAADVDGGRPPLAVLDDDGGRVVRLRAGQIGDLLVDHARAGRKDLERVLAHQEARHVEVVDRHVLEDAAAALHVLLRRRGRVARREPNLDGRADLAVHDGALDAHEVGVEAALQRDHQLNALLAREEHALDGLVQLGGNRLLAKDVLAGVRRRRDLLRVELRR